MALDIQLHEYLLVYDMFLISKYTSYDKQIT